MAEVDEGGGVEVAEVDEGGGVKVAEVDEGGGVEVAEVDEGREVEVTEVDESREVEVAEVDEGGGVEADEGLGAEDDTICVVLVEVEVEVDTSRLVVRTRTEVLPEGGGEAQQLWLPIPHATKSVLQQEGTHELYDSALHMIGQTDEVCPSPYM